VRRRIIVLSTLGLVMLAFLACITPPETSPGNIGDNPSPPPVSTKKDAASDAAADSSATVDVISDASKDMGTQAENDS
jgi:hypothetical protein